MIEMMVTTGDVRCAKLQSNRHNQQTNTQFFTVQMPSCPPTNSVRALKRKEYQLRNVTYSVGLLCGSKNTPLGAFSMQVHVQLTVLNLGTVYRPGDLILRRILIY